MSRPKKRGNGSVRLSSTLSRCGRSRNDPNRDVMGDDWLKGLNTMNTNTVSKSGRTGAYRSGCCTRKTGKMSPKTAKESPVPVHFGTTLLEEVFSVCTVFVCLASTSLKIPGRLDGRISSAPLPPHMLASPITPQSNIDTPKPQSCSRSCSHTRRASKMT